MPVTDASGERRYRAEGGRMSPLGLFAMAAVTAVTAALLISGIAGILLKG